MHARAASFFNGVWQLQDVSRLAFRDEKIEKHHWPEQRWRSTLTPDKLGVMSIKPELLSLKGLAEYIEYRQVNQQESSRYQLAYWRKATQPLTIVAMLLLALSFIFGPLRSVTMAARVLMGILTGFGFYMANEVFGPVALVYQLPPLLGAIAPSGLFIGIAVYLMQKRGLGPRPTAHPDVNSMRCFVLFRQHHHDSAECTVYRHRRLSDTKTRVGTASEASPYIS